MSRNPNNTPEQKEAWQEAKRLGDWVKGGVTPAHQYNPQRKGPSRRDRRRIAVREFHALRPHGHSIHEWLTALTQRGFSISSRH